ncbi:hypothetical protein EPA93_15610 [Ktedonosporobacter rubrisoli]|uniref:Uncharacterized protein n=1 Tax=Ktedonosporobacter rubrisoli TaxID=2509675 RepID=A0A4V0YYT5_KTERU|nr:hypothetical protein [Ktedonosporobacter rubrisoli]QBD77341.1 hypothetical protein EPA93_15610 [Ktedonosporobacter rubrisoli]
MQRSTSSLFRKEALDYYRQSKEQNVLPRLVAPPVFLFLWILMCLFALMVVIASLGQIPIYASGSGVVLAQHSIQSKQVMQESTVLLFFPITPIHPLQLHTGARVHFHIGISEQQINGTVDIIVPEVLSPAEAQQRYRLDGRLSQIISGPSIAAFVKSAIPLPAQFYANSLVSAQVQIGSASVLSLIISKPVASTGEAYHASV